MTNKDKLCKVCGAEIRKGIHEGGKPFAPDLAPLNKDKSLEKIVTTIFEDGYNANGGVLYMPKMTKKEASAQINNLVKEQMLSLKPDKRTPQKGETPEGTTIHLEDGTWLTAQDDGFNAAIDEIDQAINERFK